MTETSQQTHNPPKKNTCLSFLRQTSDEDLTVTGKMVMLRTEDYNANTNQEMQNAVVEVTNNKTITEELSLNVNPDSVEVDGKHFKDLPPPVSRIPLYLLPPLQFSLQSTITTTTIFALITAHILKHFANFSSPFGRTFSEVVVMSVVMSLVILRQWLCTVSVKKNNNMRNQAISFVVLGKYCLRI